MDIVEMFSDSYVSYPFSNFSRIVVLGILFCTGIFLIIPAIFAGGYLLRIIENTIKGNYELPPFENWKKMFIDGLKIAVVIIFYALPGLITEIALISLIHANYPLMLAGELSICLFIFTVLFYIAAYILSITAIPRMAYNGQLKAGLEVKEVIRDIRTIGFKKYTLSLLGLSIMAAYLMLFSGYLHEIFYAAFYFIGPTTLITVFLVNSIADFMIYPLLITAQGRLMGLIYLEKFNHVDS
ncbi:MAG: DUF4013 domain-containing protein [Methanobacterium sp.]